MKSFPTGRACETITIYNYDNDNHVRSVARTRAAVFEAIIFHLLRKINTI